MEFLLVAFLTLAILTFAKNNVKKSEIVECITQKNSDEDFTETVASNEVAIRKLFEGKNVEIADAVARFVNDKGETWFISTMTGNFFKTHSACKRFNKVFLIKKDWNFADKWTVIKKYGVDNDTTPN